MPALIFNSRKVMPAGKTFYFRPHSLAMHFLPPVVAAKDDTVEV